MKEICIPLSVTDEQERAEVIVRLPDSGNIFHYRLESVNIDKSKTQNGTQHHISKLKQFIKNYSPKWELIQILDTAEGSEYVHILYREQVT